MRGFVEESAEVRALRGLRDAARQFVGADLLNPYGDTSIALSSLQKAALLYAATQPKPRAKKKVK